MIIITGKIEQGSVGEKQNYTPEAFGKAGIITETVNNKVLFPNAKVMALETQVFPKLYYFLPDGGDDRGVQ
jgi:hypothetical protein